MRAPRHCDIVRAFRLLGTIDERVPGPGHGRVGELLETLARIVPAELLTLSVCDLSLGRRLVSAQPAGRLGLADLACFDRLMSGHPLVRYHLRHPHARVRRISDCLPLAQFHDSELFQAYYRPLGIDSAVLLPIGWQGDELRGIVLNRAHGDFTDGEAALLELLRHQVVAIYRQSVAMACAACAENLLRRLPDGERVAMVRLDPQLQVVDASGEGLFWLAELARDGTGGGTALSEPLRRWLRARLQALATAPNASIEPAVLKVRPGLRLAIRCLPLACGAGCTLLLERQPGDGLSALPDDRSRPQGVATRLTARQTEILGWIAAGKTDACVGELLGVSKRTVQKHLQNIYRQLGVSNRTGAVMRALGR